MIPSAAPRRLQGRFIFFSAIASLFLLWLFLWQTADPRIGGPRLGSTVADAEQTISNDGSLYPLMHDSDEYLDEYVDEYESVEHIDLKPTPIIHPFSLSLPPASPSLSTTSSRADQSYDATPTEPAQTPAPATSLSTHLGGEITASQTPRIPGKPNNLTISGFVFYGRRDRVESMHCYLEVGCVDILSPGQVANSA